MKQFRLTIFAAALASTIVSSAGAQPPAWNCVFPQIAADMAICKDGFMEVQATQPAVSVSDTFLKIVITKQVDGVYTPTEMFRLGAGGCIRGPLLFTDPLTGKEQFRLDDGVEYPAGCASRK